MGVGKPLPGESCLTLSLWRQGRVTLALEAPFDDPLGLAMPQEHNRGVQTCRDRGRGGLQRRVLTQRSPPSRIVHTSISAS